VTATSSFQTLLASAWVATAIALGGCTALPAGENRANSQTTSIAPAAATTIDLAGRLSVSWSDASGPQNMSGSFEWRQRPEATDIALLSPLGQTLAELILRPGQAQMNRPGQTPHLAADADQLTLETLGWPLPLNGFSDWLQGHGTDRDGNLFAATPSRARFQTRDGWQLEYASWQPDGRPRRLDLARQTAEAGFVRIRVVLDSVVPQ